MVQLLAVLRLENKKALHQMVATATAAEKCQKKLKLGQSGWERAWEAPTLALAAKRPAEDVTARPVPRCSAAPAACPGCCWHPPRVIRDGDTHTFPSPNTPPGCGESGSQPHLPSVQGSRLVREEQHLLPPLLRDGKNVRKQPDRDHSCIWLKMTF